MPIQIKLDQGNRDVLDLSKSLVRSREELDRVLEKVPDFRTRPEKVRPEDLQIPASGSNFSFTVTKSELSGVQTKNLSGPFPSPILPPMNSVELENMRSVDIDWRMLTTCRPLNKVDEYIFSRVVALERHAYKFSERDNEQRSGRSSNGRRGPQKRSNSKGSMNAGSGRTGNRSCHQTCRECGEEFCTGSCKEHQYEIHERLPPVEEDDDAPPPQLLALGDGDKENKGKKKKVGKKMVKAKEKEEPEETKKKVNAKENKANEKKDTISHSRSRDISKRFSAKNDKPKRLEKSKSAPPKEAKASKKTKEVKSEKKAGTTTPPGLIAPEVTAAKLRKRSPRPRKNVPRDRTPTNASKVDIGPEDSVDATSSSRLKPPDEGSEKVTPTSPRSAASPRPRKTKKSKTSDNNSNSAKTNASTKTKTSKSSSNKQSRNATDANAGATTKTTPKKSSPKKHDRNKSPETMVRRIKI